LKDKNTPAEKCEIDIEGENKWLMLVQNASNSNEISYKINLFRITNF